MHAALKYKLSILESLSNIKSFYKKNCPGYDTH